MAGNWYVNRGGPQPEGPYTTEQVLAGLVHGHIPPTSTVCPEGGAQWIPIAAVPEFSAAAAAATFGPTSMQQQMAVPLPAQFAPSTPLAVAAPVSTTGRVKEFRRTCRSCGKVWHSLVSREVQLKSRECGESCNQSTTSCGMCGQIGKSGGGYWSAAGTHAQERRNKDAIVDELERLHRCPSCGSANYFEEVIGHG